MGVSHTRFFLSSRRRHTRFDCDWSSDVCSSDLEAGEQPEEAMRRELREEIGLEVEQVEIFTSRSFTKPRQVEILFRCRANTEVKPLTIEVERAEWFSVQALPEGLPKDQRPLIERAATCGAKGRD